MAQKAFIFDLDGVLVDTAVFHFQAWQKLAHQLGFSITHEFNETLKGISRMDSLDKILAFGKVTLSQEEKQQYAQVKNEWYLDLVNQMTEENILPGVKDFLIKTRELNIATALGSASKNAPVILEKTGLSPYFDAIIDGNQVSKSKPDPEVFVKGAESLGVKNENCVVFEDAFAGIEAAKNAGMKAVGVGEAEVLYNADVVVNDFVGREPEEFLTSPATAGTAPTPSRGRGA